MSETITKERLKGYAPLCRSIENQLERLTRLKNSELLPATPESDGSQRQPGATGSRMANALIRRLTYEDEIMPDIEAKMHELETIRAAVNRLEDPQEQEVLRFRYIDCPGYKPALWADVAMQIYRDDDECKIKAVQRIHERALININKT